MDFNTPGYEDMELSTQILIKAALERNIGVEVLDKKDNFIRLSKGGKTEYVKQATRTSADSYIAPLIMENKAVTKRILDEQGIRIPHGKIYTDAETAVKDYSFFKGTGTVIKPNNTNFGIGVTILEKGFGPDEFDAAVRTAFSHDHSVIAEEYIRGKEYRFLVINGKTLAVLHRIPANVEGNGIYTVEELVDIKNENPLRGKGYVKPLEIIRLGDTELEFLEEKGRNTQYVPKKNETVYLRKNSNISTGGDSIDFTDEVHEGYKEIAVKAAKAAGAKICGADIIIRDIKAKPDEKNYAVIELNFNPALHIHAFPYRGMNRYPEEHVLNLLGF